MNPTAPPSLGRQLRRRKPLATGSAHSGPELQRTIGTFQLTMFGVGATVGTGIFFVLQEAVPAAGPSVVLSFLIAGLCAGLSALCYAEMAAAIPVSGSTFSYAYHALGEGVAVFIAGCVLLEYGVATGAVAVGWSGYFNELLNSVFGWKLPDALSYSPIAGPDGGTTGIVNLPAVILVAMCAVLLIRGASESAKVNAIMVCIKLVDLALFVVIAFTAFKIDHFDNFFAHGPSGVALAAGTIFFSFIGLDAVATAGEEVKNPQKTMPRAIIAALAIVVTIYVLVAIAGVGSQEVERFSDEDQQSAGLSVILFNITGSHVPGTILAAGAVISIFSVTLVTLYGQTRILFAIGRDGLISKKFARVNPRTLPPSFNTVVVAIVVALIGGFVPADYLWDTVSIGTLFAFSVVAIGVIVLRRTEPDLPRSFTVPLYPLTPIITVLACAYLIFSLRLVTIAIFVGWIVVCIAFYLIYSRRHATLNRADGAASEPVPESMKGH